MHIISKEKSSPTQAKLFKTFVRDEDGNILATTAISMVSILRGQSIADASALYAATYVRSHGTAPKNKDEGLIGQYTAKELGYNYSGLGQGDAEDVTVTISYDDLNNEATATVEGQTMPFFSQILGKDNLSFSAKSVVKYQNVSHDAIPRIDALEASVKSFMKTLDDLVDDQSKTPEGQRILRTGMLAFNSNTISARTVNMNWGTISDANINSMQASGGTDSSSPLRTARDWMKLEDAIHKSEHEKAPLKFAIFMTDGVNTSGETVWEPKDDTGYWRLYSCYDGCAYYYATSADNPNYDFEANGWEEGERVLTANPDSLADCLRMSNEGVKVYTIGFALEEGYYEQNYTSNGYMQYAYTDEDTSEGAYTFLQGCASSEELFLKAENAETLESAFQKIGANIVKESIRISN